ncbi:MAG: UDP-3-O-acyl-N-acetylglucosamine deacetylase, partial [Cyanobacteria bacterium P01_G01_bin.38]
MGRANSLRERSLDLDAAAVQQTLVAAVTCTGVGLHLGQTTLVKILPAEVGAGRYFVRTDMAGAAPVSATVDQVVQTQLSTELGQLTPVRTVEHLLASLWALGVDNARIEIDGPEVPLLDGSAQSWVSAIESVGVAAQAMPRSHRVSLSAPVTVQSGDAFVVAMPAPSLRFTYGIDFDLSAIGNQWHSWSPDGSPNLSFASEVAPARTFGLAHQIDYLRSQGLIKGGSLDNALVCSQDGWVNPPLRFANEPARHKLLDLVGDLSLLGDLPTMHVMAYKASHHLHVQLAQKLAEVCPI